MDNLNETTSLMRDDLKKSGLEPSDMGVRASTQTEIAATGSPMAVKSYVIPYYDIYGKAIPFYRTRLFDWTPKYRQLKDQPNHIYFPKGFWELAQTAKCIIFTEGEKKAAAAVKQGYAAVAAGGVDSYINRTLEMPKDVTLSTIKGKVVAKMPAGQEVSEKTGSMAEGMQGLLKLVLSREIPIVIIYDSDKDGLSETVAAASAKLGYTLRFNGLSAKHIRQLVLKAPATYMHDKIALDDIMADSEMHADFDIELDKCLAAVSAFPKHPNPRQYINKKLRSNRLGRQQMSEVCTALLCDLDAKGVRIRSPYDDSYYYFNREEHRLIKISFKLNESFPQSSFGVYLYNQYNLSLSDNRLLTTFTSMFCAEDPIIQAHPTRVLTLKNDTLYYQAGEGSIVKVNAQGISIIDNGMEGILFVSDAVKPIDTKKLMHYIEKGMQEPLLPNIWYKTLQETRIASSQGSDTDYQRKLLSLLYSISPWFYRWRGTQLPIEMTIGEPGSGKSSLYQLRLGILTGEAKLRNAPNEKKDWVASIASAGGMHVTDNVHMVNNQLRQELSDEMCRLVTEPDPHIEQRKLYSDNELIRTPVQAVFAITAVRQPFTNVDIIQRSIITELDKGDEAVEYDADWVQHQMDFNNGREGWLANQFIFQHRMFQKVASEWQSRFKASYRLVNIEQLIEFASEIYGWEKQSIAQRIQDTQEERISTGDLALEGLLKFTIAWLQAPDNNLGDGSPFTANTVVQWAKDNDTYRECTVLVNTRKLGHYIKTNRTLVANQTGIKEHDKTHNNAKLYYVAFVRGGIEKNMQKELPLERTVSDDF